jgi:crotonobetainyl-CoA:carnitine CoA-transferase CaiB-like acyl-CoA transferase
VTPALSGLQVLDFGQGVAGPYCGQLLGDHGADIIKIEPPRGDWSRTMGAQNESRMSGTFISVNRNKRGLCLDLKNGDAVSVVRTLALKADVVVDSFRPGVMDRLGLGYEELRKQNPKLIYCAVTGFGESGPSAGMPAGDSTMQAYGGLMSIVGERDGNPLRVGNVVSDMLTGTNAFSGVLLALLGRTATGSGRKVSVSLLDSIVAFQAPPLTEYLLTNMLPQRTGNEHPLIAPSGSARTEDGMIMFTVFDHHWTRFCEEMGVPALATDPRFCDSGARQRSRDDLRECLAPVFLRRTSEQWLGRLRSMDILCAPINEYCDLVQDPQVVHNNLIQFLAGPGNTSLPSIRNPVRVGSNAAPLLAPPRIGEHTYEILKADLQYGDEHIEYLVQCGAAIVATSAVLI